MGSGVSSQNRSSENRSNGNGPRNLRIAPNLRDSRAREASSSTSRGYTRQPTAERSSSRFSRTSLSDRNQQLARNNNLISILRSNGRGLTHIICHQCRSIHWTLTNNPETCRLCGSGFIEIFDAAAHGIPAPGSVAAAPMRSTSSASGNSDDYLLNMAYIAGMRDMHPLMGLYGQSIEERVMAESFNNQPYIAHPAPKEVIAMLLPQRYDKYANESKEELDADKKECAVCKENFAPEDLITELPKCLHIFHQDCCIQWLELQSTCPICRNMMCSMAVFDKEIEEEKDGFDEDQRIKQKIFSKLAQDYVSSTVETAILSVSTAEEEEK
mmetsp:Transcript_11831/g.15462  ORF Transcript_11831/g.15462 Transcript_11831/m.15462 type:complete len:327 (+) Transcript_11831:271-1251(+)